MVNRTIVPKHRTNYNYQEILGFRAIPTNWRKIAEYYGRKHPNAMNWFNRETERLERKHSGQLRKKARKRTTKKKKESTEVSTTHPRYEVRRGEKYGEYDMTDYSFINGKEITTDLIIEWFDKFCDHIWKWNPVPDYLEEMVEETFFKDFVIVLEPRKHGKTIILSLVNCDTAIFCCTSSWCAHSAWLPTQVPLIEAILTNGSRCLSCKMGSNMIVKSLALSEAMMSP